MRRFGLYFAVCVLTAVRCLSAEVSIRLENATEKNPASTFILSGLSPQQLELLRKRTDADSGEWVKAFAVYALTNGEQSPTAMLGDYSIRGDAVVFEPKYPLRLGMAYRAIAHSDSVGKASDSFTCLAEFTFGERPRRDAARLTQIFPSGEVQPENLLRFYLHFSAPMSRGEAYRRIHLLDGKGKVVEAPFLELGEELWSPDGQRFTLYFDPGRIKRGLQPRELFGPALREGESYTLVIDREWQDAEGVALAQSATKKFQVVAPDDVQPNPKNWKVRTPKVGSRQPLAVEFDEPLDSAMVERVISMRNSKGEEVDGKIRLEGHETKWLFEPAKAWTSGTYQLVVLKILEDRAGNSIRRPFEVDILRPATDASDKETVEIKFQVGE